MSKKGVKKDDFYSEIGFSPKPRGKLENNDAYYLGQKVALENKYLILHKINLKSILINNYSDKGIMIAKKFVNSYCLKIFDRI